MKSNSIPDSNLYPSSFDPALPFFPQIADLITKACEKRDDEDADDETPMTGKDALKELVSVWKGGSVERGFQTGEDIRG